MTNYQILTPEDYEQAKKELAEIFNTDACQTDSEGAHRLMKAMDQYEINLSKARCTAEAHRK